MNQEQNANDQYDPMDKCWPPGTMPKNTLQRHHIVAIGLETAMNQISSVFYNQAPNGTETAQRARMSQTSHELLQFQLWAVACGNTAIALDHITPDTPAPEIDALLALSNSLLMDDVMEDHVERTIRHRNHLQEAYARTKAEHPAALERNPDLRPWQQWK